jgi:hypothetical protein
MFGLEKYNYTTDKTLTAYSFMSNGPQGPIQKIAKFTEPFRKGTNYDEFLGRRKGAFFMIQNQ